MLGVVFGFMRFHNYFLVESSYATPEEGSLIRLLSLFEYILEDSGSAENKEILLFSHDKLSLASILRPLHQVTFMQVGTPYFSYNYSYWKVYAYTPYTPLSLSTCRPTAVPSW